VTTTLDRFVADWQQWHTERNESLRRPLGWLSLTALHWLDSTPTRFEEVPGRWHVAGTTVVRDLDGEITRLEPAEGAPGAEVEFDRGFVEVIQRTGRFGIRIHDREAPALSSFTHIPAYHPDPAWRLTGRFTPFTDERVVTTGAVVDGLEHHHRAAGVVRFRHDGAEHELVAFGDAEGPLQILFTDATSGVTTYPAARTLRAERTGNGSVVLDFTRAANLPCAFTDAATCPIAPPENRLPFAVDAGERNPRTGGAPA